MRGKGIGFADRAGCLAVAFMAAKAAQPQIDIARVRARKAQGMGATESAKELGIGRASVYRVLEADSI